MSADATAASLATARTLLFVPGDRPERIDKATGSGADGVVVDLEDAVAPDRKPAARDAVAGWLAGHAAHDRPVPVLVRVNGADTDWFGDDVAAAAGADALMLPKATAAALDALAARAPGAVVLALVETARGVLDAAAVAAHPQVARLVFGSMDLGAELGVSPHDQDALRAARSALVLASAAAGLPSPVDGVTLALDDEDALRADVVAAARLGLPAKMLVHPRQVAATHKALAPDPEALDRARRVVAAAEAAPDGGVVDLDGEMVDAPVVAHARRVVAVAERAGADGGAGSP